MHHTALKNSYLSLCVNNDLDIDFPIVIDKYVQWMLRNKNITLRLGEKCIYPR